MRSGISLFLELKSTVLKQYKFTVRDKNNKDVYSKNIDVSTEYSYRTFSIPSEFTKDKFSFYISQVEDNATLSVRSLYYENHVYSANIKPTHSGVKGEIVYNSFPTINDPIGWVCVSTGVDWRPFGIVY